MQRLTYKNSDGTWGMNNGFDMHKVPSELYGALWKLKDYEESGLDPEEVMKYKELGVAPVQLLEIDELYKEKCEEVNRLTVELQKYKRAAEIKTVGGAGMTEKLIKSYEDAIDCLKKNKPTSGFYMLQESVDMAIKALEEIQQYRAIGTLEECRAAVEKQKVKRPDYEGDAYADGHLVYDTWICPNCSKHYEVDYDNYDYCPDCGQKLDWSDEE